MDKYLKKIKSSSFLKNVLLLVSGTAGAQIIGLLTTPIITRIYGPEAFGLMGTYLAITTIITPIAAMTYPIAIVLPKQEEEARKIAGLSLNLTLLLSLFSFLVIATMQEKIIEVFSFESIGNYLYLIPMVIFFSGYMQVMQQWLIRKKEFKINAKATFYQSVLTNLGKIIYGIFYASASVLIIFQSITNAVKAILIMINSKVKPSYFTKNLSLNDIKMLMIRYRDFPLYRAPESLISAFSHSVPILVLSSLFGPASAGYYSVSRTVLELPSRLIGEAIGDVFYPKITEAKHEGKNISKLILQATLALVLVGIVPFGIVSLFGPSLFKYIFGLDWEMAGEYARWVSLWAFGTFINKPSVRSMPVLNAQRLQLIFTIIRLILVVLSLYIGFIVYKDDITALILFSVSGLLLNIIMIAITIIISQRKR